MSVKAARLMEVSPADLREGDEIVAVGARHDDPTWPEPRMLRRPLRVRSGGMQVCIGQWRTHVHDPSGGCWDTRVPLQVRRWD